jgi:hypothetical protein
LIQNQLLRQNSLSGLTILSHVENTFRTSNQIKMSTAPIIRQQSAGVIDHENIETATLSKKKPNHGRASVIDPVGLGIDPVGLGNGICVLYPARIRD